MKYQAKYYDGQRPISVPVTWELRDKAIAIRLINGNEAIWPLEEIQQDEIHNTAIVIQHKLTGDRIELIDGEEALPPAILTQKKVKFEAKLFAGFVTGILAVIFIYWLSLPMLTKHVAHKVPVNYEKLVGDKLFETTMKDLKLCQSPSAESELAFQKLILMLNPEKDLSFMIVKSPEVNAFAYPGGRIVILSGLLKKMKSSDEFAGIMAHEIAHARRRHVMQKVITAASTTVFIQFLTGNFSSGFALDPSTAVTIGSLTFDRRMEQEADEDALETVIRAGIDPEKVAKFFTQLEDVPDALTFLSTHPGKKERAALFRSKKINYKPVPILSSKEWEHMKRYCEPKVKIQKVRTRKMPPLKKTAINYGVLTETEPGKRTEKNLRSNAPGMRVPFRPQVFKMFRQPS